jgi:carboxypeptidase Q
MRAGLALLFLQLIPAVLYAQSNAAGTAAAPYQDLRTAALADTRAYDLLESLTTEVGPRMPGTAGDTQYGKARL